MATTDVAIKAYKAQSPISYRMRSHTIGHAPDRKHTTSAEWLLRMDEHDLGSGFAMNPHTWDSVPNDTRRGEVVISSKVGGGWWVATPAGDWLGEGKQTSGTAFVLKAEGARASLTQATVLQSAKMAAAPRTTDRRPWFGSWAATGFRAFVASLTADHERFLRRALYVAIALMVTASLLAAVGAPLSAAVASLVLVAWGGAALLLTAVTGREDMFNPLLALLILVVGISSLVVGVVASLT